MARCMHVYVQFSVHLLTIFLGRLGINHGIQADNDVFASRFSWQLPEQSVLIFAE